MTLRSVGSNGGQAAAFAFDLARSIVLTRQGNPSWVGQERDGVVGDPPGRSLLRRQGRRRPARLARHDQDRHSAGRRATAPAGEPDRDDEPSTASRCLGSGTSRASEKAAVVMTGDDHAFGGTAGRFDQYKAASPPAARSRSGTACAERPTSIPHRPLTNAQAAAVRLGGIRGLRSRHDFRRPCLRRLDSRRRWRATYTSQLQQFTAKYTSVPPPVTHRLHCVGWSDWATQPKVELARGIRFDTNYYHYPAGWIGALPGYMTGSATIMRFADTDGTPIDVYQAHTHMDDEASQAYPATVERAPRRTPSAPRGTTASSPRTCTPTRRPRRAPTRSSRPR